MEIKNVLFDLDGTLGINQPNFDECLGNAKLYLAETLSLPISEVNERFGRYLNRSRAYGHVNPYALVSGTIGVFRLMHPGISQKLWNTAEEMMWDVYSRPMKPYNETHPVMKKLKRKGRRQGVVTHGAKPWTEWKEECLDIKQYLVHSRCFSVKVTGPKNRDSWIEAAKFYGFNIWETAVIGDNLRDDANAAMLAGFGMVAWLDRPEHVWGHITQGQLLAGIAIVNNLKQFASLVLK